MGSYFKIVSAGPLFFVSAWIAMLFAGMVHLDVGIRPFGYTTSLLVTIGLWLTIAPAAAAIAGVSRSRQGKRSNTAHT